MYLTFTLLNAPVMIFLMWAYSIEEDLMPIYRLVAILLTTIYVPLITVLYIGPTMKRLRDISIPGWALGAYFIITPILILPETFSSFYNEFGRQSAWLFLLYLWLSISTLNMIFIMILALIPGVKGDNKYGEDPRNAYTKNN